MKKRYILGTLLCLMVCAVIFAAAKNFRNSYSFSLPELITALDCSNKNLSPHHEIEDLDRSHYQPVEVHAAHIRANQAITDGYKKPYRPSYLIAVESYNTPKQAETRAKEYRSSVWRERIAASGPYDSNSLSKQTVRCFGYAKDNRAFLITTHSASNSQVARPIEEKLRSYLGIAPEAKPWGSIALRSPTKKQPSPENEPSRSAKQRDLDRQLSQIHNQWLGTPWAYSGTSQIAGEGSIACGYFVTTTLRDVGLAVDRIRLAQAASETMILEICDPKSIRRFSDAPLTKVIASLQKQGEGYYIVGLDNHTGFLRVDLNDSVKFIHSGPGKGVVIEAPEKSEKLSSSRYRVTGKIDWRPNDRK